MVKAQNRLIGVIANTDIYQEDDLPQNASNDSSADKLSSSNRGELQISNAQGGKKQATFLEKLSFKSNPELASYGFL